MFSFYILILLLFSMQPINENLESKDPVAKDPSVVLPNLATSNLFTKTLDDICELYEDDYNVNGWDSSDDEPTTEVNVHTSTFFFC